MKTATTPCPLCDSTKGRTLVGAAQAPTAAGSKVKQFVARVQKWRCFGCGKTYTEESDRS